MNRPADARELVVSPALHAYAAMVMSADTGAVPDDEADARRFFDEHGYWPDQADRR